MINLKINGRPVSVPEGSTILEAAKAADVVVPTLCFLKEISDAGACRVCVVEVKGADRLVAACNTPAAEGMEVETDTERVRETRKRNVQLILANHDCRCLECSRNGKCRLQSLARDMGLLEDTTYPKKVAKDRWDASLPFIRRDSKCISCLRCVNVCSKVQTMDVWDLAGLGRTAKVCVRGGKSLSDAGCVYCGQCVANCPVAALDERDDTRRFTEAIYDPSKTVVMQVAPAVRAAWAEDLGLSPEVATEGRMVAAFRRLGVKYVFDTCFGADITVMEEASELLEGIGERKMPLFTSCCPGWVRFLKHEYPDMVRCLSSSKSPQLMFGGAVKSAFAEKIGKKPEDMFCVSVMPCIAKKWESTMTNDVDLVLTTREAAALVARFGIDAATLKESPFDSPFGFGSGAAVIFGASGGVMEAALRTAHFLATGKNPDPDAFKIVRGSAGRREVVAEIAGREVRACVASGLANARQVVEDVRSGKTRYDFVEIMACPGGCARGGGQPFCEATETVSRRSDALYSIDSARDVRFSHDNPDVKALYDGFFGAPLSPKAREILHTDQSAWQL